MKQVARFLLWLSGWKVDLAMPEEHRRCVLIAAPHTSNWDFYYLRLAFWVMKVPMKVAIKNDWTKFPFGMFVKPMGGVGVDRSPKKLGDKRKSQIESMGDLFEKYDDISLVIAAEGTRRLVKHWKMGYYWIAKRAEVPILCGYLDYQRKVAGIGPYVLHIKDNPDEELKPIMEFYSGIIGKNPSQFHVDERYA